MLCDAISAVTEFMVRVVHSGTGIRIHDVAGVEALPYIYPIASP